MANWLRVLSVAAIVASCGCEKPSSFRVPGGGMEPSIRLGQKIKLDRLAYGGVGDVRRGDIVVFRASDDRLIVKRVLGLPGERVRVQDGRVSINGTPVPLTVDAEDGVEGPPEARYSIRLGSACGGTKEVQVPDDALFVIGDNRCASWDSRDFGAVGFTAIQGKVAQAE